MAWVEIRIASTGYKPDQIYRTMTLDDLIDCLEELREEVGGEAKIYTTQDNRYTFGGISYDSFEIMGRNWVVANEEGEVIWEGDEEECRMRLQYEIDCGRGNGLHVEQREDD